MFVKSYNSELVQFDIAICQNIFIRKNSNIRICIIVFTHSLRQLFIAGLKELKIPEQNVYICTSIINN